MRASVKKYIKIYENMPVQMKASFWFLVCSFLRKGISMVTTPIFTRILTAAQYGQYSVFNSWMAILQPIVCLNLHAGVYAQGVVKFEEDRKRYTSSLQGLVLILVTVWTVIYLSTRSFWNQLFSLTTVQMMAMLLMIWIAATYGFWSMDQKVDFKYRKLAALTIAVSVIQPAVCIILVLVNDDKVTARILGMAVVQAALYGWTFFSHMAKGKLFYSRKYWLYALKFNIPLLPHYLSMNVLSSSDRIMISAMAGDNQAGIYNLAYSVSLIMNIFSSALLQTIEPWIYRKLKERRTGDLERVAYPSFLFISALDLLLILFAPEMIRIFAPAEYYEAIWVIPSVALSGFFTFLYTFFATFEFYFEKTGYIAGATVGGAVLNIVLNYVFIRRFGYVAAGYTTLFGYILFAALHYGFMRRVCREQMEDVRPYKGKIIVGIGVGSLAAGMVIMLTYPVPVLRYSLIAVILASILMLRRRIAGMVKTLLRIRRGGDVRDGET